MLEIIEITTRFVNATGAGWVMWLLLVLSVLSVAVMVERFIFYRKRYVNAGELGAQVSQALREGNLEHVRAILEPMPGMEAKVLTACLNRLGEAHGSEAADLIDEVREMAVLKERENYERGLAFLGTLGNNAPFLGLFGTVLGIIKAFSDMNTGGAGGNSAVMVGISEALVATAVGLLVALPAVAAFNTFKLKVRKVADGSNLLAGIVRTQARRFNV